MLLGGALLLRLTLLPALPDLSDDLYRYVWDGWLGISGVNPWRLLPADPAFADRHGSVLFRAMNSPAYHSVYPPLSQIVFLGAGWVYERWGWPAAAWAIKGGFLVLEFAGILALHKALRALGARTGALALYAWNPLVLVAVAGSGHSEGGLLLGMGLLAWGVAAGGWTRAWLGLALAVHAKIIPVLLAPLLLRRHRAQAGPRRIARDAAPGLLIGGALALPILAPGALAGIAASLDLYVRLFEFNGGPYLLLREGVRLLTGEDYGGWIGPALRVSFLASAGLLWIRWPVESAESWFRGALLLLGGYLATATTVHPWYLLWGLAFVPFTPFLRPAWLWASWAAFPTYLTYAGVPHGALAALFWGGVGIALAREGEGPLRTLLLRIAGRRKARQVAEVVGKGLLLDLGAGEGFVGASLAARECRILLADRVPGFRVPLPGLVYDGRRLPLRDRSVDVVLLSLVLHHADDPDTVLREALRVARRRVVITESTYRWGWERRLLERLDRWANRGRAWEDPAARLHFRTVPEWEAAFGEAGGRIVESRRLNRVGHRHHLFVLEPGPGPDRAQR